MKLWLLELSNGNCISLESTLHASHIADDFLGDSYERSFKFAGEKYARTSLDGRRQAVLYYLPNCLRYPL